MTYQPVNKIFDILTERHREASEACQRAENAVPSDSREAMLLQRLETFESKVFKRLKEEEENTSDKIGETWIQYIPLDPVDEAVASLKNASPDEIPERLLTFHQAINELLKTISEQVSSEKVGEFFESLMEVEENYSRQCAMEQVRENEV